MLFTIEILKKRYFSRSSMNTKASAALAVVAVVLALVILGIFLVNISQRDCNSNRDCSANAYCGVDYGCHPFPEQIIVKENNFIPAALIVSMALIIAAYIFSKRKNNLLRDQQP